jgi:hypothetical protein
MVSPSAFPAMGHKLEDAMRINPYAKSVALVSAVAAALLTGCTHHQTPKISNTELTTSHIVQDLQITQLNKQVELAKSKIALDNKNIPLLLAESDVALKRAQNLKKEAAAVKNAKERQLAQNKATKAQDLADAKAQQLVADRQDLYAQLGAIAGLQKQIEGLHGQDKTAGKLSALKDNDANGAKKGKHRRRIAQKKSDSHT